MVSNMLGHRPPQVYVLSTGAGKSHIIAAAAKAINDHILILQPSKEILEQNFLNTLPMAFMLLFTVQVLILKTYQRYALLL